MLCSGLSNFSKLYMYFKKLFIFCDFFNKITSLSPSLSSLQSFPYIPPCLLLHLWPPFSLIFVTYICISIYIPKDTNTACSVCITLLVCICPGLTMVLDSEWVSQRISGLVRDPRFCYNVNVRPSLELFSGHPVAALCLEILQPWAHRTDPSYPQL